MSTVGGTLGVLQTELNPAEEDRLLKHNEDNQPNRNSKVTQGGVFTTNEEVRPNQSSDSLSETTKTDIPNQSSDSLKETTKTDIPNKTIDSLTETIKTDIPNQSSDSLKETTKPDIPNKTIDSLTETTKTDIPNQSSDSLNETKKLDIPNKPRDCLTETTKPDKRGSWYTSKEEDMPNGPRDSLNEPTKFSLLDERQNLMTTVETDQPVEEEPAAPDGGWGWAVLVGCIYITMLMISSTTCFSLMFGRKLKGLNMSASTISWIFNIYSFSFDSTIIYCVPLAAKFGWRPLALPASCLTAISFFMLSFAFAPWHFFLLFSIFVGISGGIAYNITLLILPSYFDKRRGFATCLNATAMGFTQIVMPQIIRILQENLGWVGSNIIYTGLMLNCCVAAALFRPLNKNKKVMIRKESLKVKEVEKLKKHQMKGVILGGSHQSLLALSSVETTAVGRRVKQNTAVNGLIYEMKINIRHSFRAMKSLKSLICFFGFSLFLIGYINYLMMIPFIVMEAGYSYEMASYCITTIATSSTITRLAMAMVADRSWFNVTRAFVAGSVIASVFCAGTIFSLSNQWLIFLTMAGNGFGVGLTISLWVVVLIETVGMGEFVYALGAYGFVVSPLFLLAGLTFGMVRDGSSSFMSSMVVAAVLQLTLALLWLLMPWARKIDANRLENDGNTWKTNVA